MSTRKDWSGSTLRERIEEVIRLRKIGINELARQAGTSSGSLSRMGRRTKQGRPDTLAKIAEVAHVSLEWLAVGTGRPELNPPSSGEVDRYPNRQEAARIARDGGLDEEPIEAVIRDPYAHLTRDPSVLWWIHQIEAHVLLGGGTATIPPRQPAPTPVAESVSRPRKRPREEK